MNAAIAIEDTGMRRWGRSISWVMRLIPVMVGIGGILDLDRLQPRVFAWWLIEVSVDTDVTIQSCFFLIPVATSRYIEGMTQD